MGPRLRQDAGHTATVLRFTSLYIPLRAETGFRPRTGVSARENADTSASEQWAPEKVTGRTGAAATRIVLLAPQDASAAGGVLARSHAD